jgi:putative addiction module component (TIGR02574 family)
MSVQELKTQVMQLSLKERAEMARDLLESLDNITEAEREELWLEEVGRRIESVQKGETKLIPIEEALNRAKQALANRHH